MSSQDSKATQSHELWVETVTNVANNSPNIVKSFIENTMAEGVPSSDPLQLSNAFFGMLTGLAANPLALVESKMGLWNDYLNLWGYTTRRMLGMEAEPIAAPVRDDKRFKDEEWEEHFVFDYIKQSYLLAANWMQETVAKAEGLDEKSLQK
ncbi:MAG: class I poly(R)-hydroxyalkanoic acid synthase, partial [Gammaproteobacteria bacterium]|nr:class I poly(R)-hydroxyalkanoic acid synthase [Gammaproteobacteria bacterium]